MNKKPTLYLIDGHSYIYRAFFAIRNLSTSKGLPTNAIYGFTQMLLKVVKERRPEYLAVAFDAKGPTLRHEAYADYKANRPEMPDAMRPQIPYIHTLVDAFHIPVLMVEGFEADDILGTVARRAEAEGFEVVLVTGDKDMTQLVTPNVWIYDSMKEREIREAEVRERFGVEPARVVEVMGLMGDTSDNIPGVPGIGEKTAVKLIAEYGTLENVLAHADDISKPALKKNLLEHADQARMSRELATIRTDCPVSFEWPKVALREPDADALKALFRELEFTTLLKTFGSAEPAPRAEGRIAETGEELDALLAAAKRFGEIAMAWIADGDDPMRAETVGLGLASGKQPALYLPLGATEARSRALEKLRGILEAETVSKHGHDLKIAAVLLHRMGITLRGFGMDPMIASYLLNADKRSHSLPQVALEHMERRMTSDEEIVGSGAKAVPFSSIPPATVAGVACERAETTARLAAILRLRLEEADLSALYQDVERPLIPVLAQIEINGMKVDAEFLADMSKELEAELFRLAEQIYRLAGMEFNINSPKQLADVLFVKLNLPTGRKTKTGFSTDEEVLTQLARRHELPATLLSYRQLAKLKSTYVDALPKMIHPETGRIHTSLNQTVTATGRLSSSEPNLQNIPIRTDIGRRIREAFIAEPGRVLLSADYSQIELRILAHLSQDTRLQDAFHRGEDIHVRTASEIFGLPAEEVTAEMRRIAKTVNFGIIYGMSAFGLSSDLGITQAEAKKTIERYFAHYSGVKSFIDRTILDAKEKGYVTTLLNRRRAIPELRGNNPATRQFGERMAVNTPIQGTAADLIKLAMIRLHARLSELGLKSLMVLQVHDELIFEVPEDEVDRMKEITRREMESVVRLSVPLRVDLGVGPNWSAAH